MCLNADNFILFSPLRLTSFSSLVKHLFKRLPFHDFYLDEKVVLSICSSQHFFLLFILFYFITDCSCNSRKLASIHRFLSTAIYRFPSIHKSAGKYAKKIFTEICSNESRACNLTSAMPLL